MVLARFRCHILYLDAQLNKILSLLGNTEIQERIRVRQEKDEKKKYSLDSVFPAQMNQIEVNSFFIHVLVN